MEIRAGRLLLERWHELAAKKENFAFETTLSGKTYAGALRKLKESGYEIRLALLWLENPGLSLKRIRQRVRKGGHDVPPDAVRRRHPLGIYNFFQLYQPLADTAYLFNSAVEPPKLVARFFGETVEVLDRFTYERIKRSAG